ncbi:MAG: outer membrane beta-barrel protein [Deltaproteobacteria bacterium]|nr:outer membrane beta-barrel protein [Deltaproteobacteria bacterium]
MAKYLKLTGFLASLAFAASFAGAGKASAAAAQAWTGNLNAVIGQRLLDNDWDPVDDQLQLSLEADFRQQSWPVSLAVGISYSWKDDSASENVGGVIVDGDFEAKLWEFDLGVKKIYDTYGLPVNPFVGVGLAVISARVEADATGNFGGVIVRAKDDDTDTGFGAWLSAGAYATIARNWNLGVQVKYTAMEKLDLLDENVKSSSFQWGALVGYRW